MHREKASIVLLFLAIAGLAVGCRKSTTVTGPDGTKATVTQRGGGVDIKVEGAGGGTVRIAESGGSVALPDNFPKDVAVYPGATVTTSATVQNTVTVVLQTSDPANKVAAFYKDKMKENGWEAKFAMDTAEGTVLTGSKDHRTQNAVIRRDGSKTEIHLTVVAEEK